MLCSGTGWRQVKLGVCGGTRWVEALRRSQDVCFLLWGSGGLEPGGVVKMDGL